MNPEPETLASLRDVKVLDLPPLLAPEYVRAQRVLPIALEDSTLTVVAPYDRDEDVEDDLRVAFNVPRVRWLRVVSAVGVQIESSRVADRILLEEPPRLRVIVAITEERELALAHR